MNQKLITTLPEAVTLVIHTIYPPERCISLSVYMSGGETVTCSLNDPSVVDRL